MFKKILVANRGEIAVRVIRACKEMGIESVAVYSDADRPALHVRKATEAYPLGASAPSESYLNIAKLLEVARRSAAEAVHPGYGFLSENPKFARACRDAGLKFIGPTPEAMELMGSKTRARQAMEKAGVPFVPGSSHGLTAAEAAKFAEQVGYPVMLKAAAGGGGKGMRLVHDPKAIKSSFEAASSEALRAFGDGEVYLEKFIVNPRHVEIQVFADEHGNTIYLGERECSIQRRHQKVLEESPSPIVDAGMRRRMGEVAVRVAQAAGYTNAGTVEFLVDGKRNFYFLEMNTRLQVEHPVTELVTGLDLVHMQIRVAAGEPLPIRQEDVHVRGHAMECRIYAEDPDNNFFPSPGKITRLLQPAGPGIRRDSGMYEGCTVPLEYDPLLAKLIAYGESREICIQRLLRAFSEYFVGGIKTNIPLFRRILLDQDFRAGKFDTSFLDHLLKAPAPENSEAEFAPVAAIGAAIFELLDQTTRRNGNGAVTPDTESAWKRTARREALRDFS